MKLSKKDIIMLLVLGIVIVVAVFYVYGIMPANEEKADLDAIIAQKQTELQDIQNQINGLDSVAYKQKIEEALENYFAHKGENVKMHPTMDKIDTEKMLNSFFKRFNAKGFSTEAWTTTSMNNVDNKDGVDTSYVYNVTLIPLSCQMKTKADYYRLIDYLGESKDFVMESTSYSINEKPEENEPAEGEDPEPVEEFYEISCNMQILFYTGEQYESDYLPDELPQVSATLSEGSTDTLVFDKVENAVSYEAYRINVKEDGTKEFVKLAGVKFTAGEENKITVKFTSDIIKTESKEAEIFIRAVGDKNTYYKSIMNQNSVGVVVTVK